MCNCEPGQPSDFEKELKALINKHGKEGESDTPDFILANYLNYCLFAFDYSVRKRDSWYGRTQEKSEEKPHET